MLSRSDLDQGGLTFDATGCTMDTTFFWGGRKALVALVRVVSTWIGSAADGW
jgi:hypothetical protein